jgi:RHS repeat-associated protein
MGQTHFRPITPPRGNPGKPGNRGQQLPRYRRSNMTYAYSATQNSGRIVSSADGVTGENVSYTYDSLNRLIAAATSGTTGVQWGDSYSYDGFGNLTSKVVTKGTAPQVYPQVNSATNQARMSGDYGFDANGNWMGSGGSQINTWNVENQLISNGSVDYSGNLLTYTYDPWGKRVMQYSVGGASGPTGTLYFYSITGQRLGIYALDYLVAGQTSVNMYFGGRLLAAVDRLGSVRGNGNGAIAYYPWGEERTSTPDGADKFATYFRDSSVAGVGEDYANARYYKNNFGRFWSADRAGHADLADPQSWNQYAYTKGDPVNFNDAGGTGDCAVGQPIPCTENVTGTSDDNSDDGEFVFAPSGLCIFSTLTLGCPVGDS